MGCGQSGGLVEVEMQVGVPSVVVVRQPCREQVQPRGTSRDCVGLGPSPGLSGHLPGSGWAGPQERGP